jgi:GMP synthase (glutamine-hydrolysing)
MPTARLLVVQHEPDAPAAWLGEWLVGAGLELDVVRGDLGDRVPERLEHDGLVVLGGAMGADDDDRHPWLGPTKALASEAVGRGVPFLGVCLGHQLAAAALGGSVVRNPHGRTVGLVPVRLTDAGRTDPLLARLGGRPAVHYNDDVVLDLPPGATVLATLPDGSPQAIRFGERAWGVQFHPETPPAVFEAWLRADHGEPSGAEAAALADVAASEAVLRAAWRPLADRFAALVTAPLAP